MELLETDETNKNKGAIYMDNFRAEYVRLTEDVEGPEFDSREPAPGAVLRENKVRLSVRVFDRGSEIDPSSLRMLVDGQAIPHSFDKETGLVTSKEPVVLASGEHRVVAEASDASGNAAVPPAAWSFEIH